MRHGRRTSRWNSLSALGPVLRCAVVLRGDSRCAWCGFSLAREDVQIDHVVPRAAGGSDDVSNLVPACSTCNNDRDESVVLRVVLEQTARPVTQALRDAARTLARAWYPWWEARAAKNRAKQRERDRRERARRDELDDEVPF